MSNKVITLVVFLYPDFCNNIQHSFDDQSNFIMYLKQLANGFWKDLIVGMLYVCMLYVHLQKI